MDLKSFALALAMAIATAGTSQALAAPVSLKGHAASKEAKALAKWIGTSGDAAGKAFAIVDKKNARMHLFDARHRLVASTSVLLGQTVGDHTVSGVGERAQAGRVGMHERTTPAGRFETEPGRNLTGEDIIWLDYDAALAIHRVRDGAHMAGRIDRLKTATPDDNRVSWGCVVVPVDFYLDKVHPVFSRSAGVVYVMPESGSPEQLVRQQL